MPATVKAGGKEMEVEAINTADARVGDRIVLNIKTGSLLKRRFCFMSSRFWP